MPWDQVACHPSVRRTIQRSIEKQMFSGTHLIYGPRGAGQITIARAIAKTLLCPERIHDFCGQCNTCRRIDERIYPDVLELTPEKTVYSIDQLREMQQQALVQPYEGPLKLFLLHDAHRMKQEAANSLLKILEEPYPHNLFLLVTDNYAGLLTTILSRCRKIRLAPLSIPALIDQLRASHTPEQAETLARAAGGLPELAQEIMEADYLEKRDQILRYLQQIRSAESYILDVIAEIGKKKEDIRSILTIMLGVIRDGTLHASGASNGPFLNPDKKSEIITLWKGETPEALIQRFEKNLLAIEAIDRNINTQFLLSEFFLTLRPQ
jgi:DNA polymerase-3 subunit delta'